MVNTTASVKAVKVRFLEGKNSREVLDFNLFLSPKDVWTAAIIPSGAGGAMIQTDDTSCTLPAIPAAGKAFVNFAYAADGAGSGLDRTQEGYVEIIEMATYLDTSTTAANVTHVNGVPPGCAAETDALASSEAQIPLGGLMGGMTLISVDSGTDYTSDAVALDNYSDAVDLRELRFDARLTCRKPVPADQQCRRTTMSTSSRRGRVRTPIRSAPC